MFTPANARATYLQASVDGASPYQLINLLFDSLLQSLRAARAGLARGDTAAKCEQLGKAVRFIEEGLKLGLDVEKGGELAANLRNLYDYCVRRLTLANLRNDDAPIAEVQGLVESVAQGWRGIAPAVSAMPRSAVAVGA
ncbi:MAG: flagellar export chaperone FliS [Pseudomonadota bacterium]